MPRMIEKTANLQKNKCARKSKGREVKGARKFEAHKLKARNLNWPEF